MRKEFFVIIFVSIFFTFGCSSKYRGYKSVYPAEKTNINMCSNITSSEAYDQVAEDGDKCDKDGCKIPKRKHVSLTLSQIGEASIFTPEEVGEIEKCMWVKMAGGNILVQMSGDITITVEERFCADRKRCVKKTDSRENAKNVLYFHDSVGTVDVIYWAQSGDLRRLAMRFSPTAYNVAGVLKEYHHVSEAKTSAEAEKWILENRDLARKAAIADLISAMKKNFELNKSYGEKVRAKEAQALGIMDLINQGRTK